MGKPRRPWENFSGSDGGGQRESGCAVLAVLVGLIVLVAGWVRVRLGKEETPPKASRGW